MSTQMRRFCTFLAVLGCVALFNGGSQVGAAGMDCTVAGLQAKAPAGTKITATKTVEAAGGLPQYCQVEGNVETPGNTVNFRLGLPAGWNGKFYFEGVGGFGGFIGPLDNGLKRGYASASTDTGHQGGADEAGWALNNRAKEIDFAYRGAHVTTVATKQLTQAYYAKAPSRSYFSGCSGGGRMSMMEANRYPEDFDGYVAGAPGVAFAQRVKRNLVFQTILKSPDHFVPPAKVLMVNKAVVAACDANDGLTDGLITDPRTCQFKIETLKCAGADAPTCLTTGQIEMLNAVYTDTQMGSHLVRGYPMGGEDGWISGITGSVPPVRDTDGRMKFVDRKSMPGGARFMDDFFRYMAFEKDDPNYDWRTFDLKRDWPKVEAMSELIVPTPDLRKLQARGGKAIIWHGWGDSMLSAMATLDYYEGAVRALGGQKKADDTVRLFLPPGMQHCRGGVGPNSFDMFTELENWVERGVPPTRVIASHDVNGVVDRTRPLCPHPQVAQYVGSGSIDAAENFRCETPAREKPASR